MFCENPLDAFHLGVVFFRNSDVGVVKLIVGLLYICMACVTVFWIHLQAYYARQGDNEAVKSVIFPIFTAIMWASAFTSVSVALVILFVPVDLTKHSNSHARFLYPIVFSMQHMVLEGVVFLLMQKGCGKYAALKAGRMILYWGIITLIANIIGYSPNLGHLSLAAQLCWDSSLLVFFFLVWVLPQNNLFRRPAAIPYARFWFFFRVLEITLYCMSQSVDHQARLIGQCGYVFGPLFIFTIFQPIVMYKTLLEDSRYVEYSYSHKQLYYCICAIVLLGGGKEYISSLPIGIRSTPL
jgi:small-conductance mechanosensitive channel